MNPLYNALAGTGNGAGWIRQFQQFRQAFTGDARQQVQQMLNSGRVTQEQYNRAVQIAQQMRGMIR